MTAWDEPPRARHQVSSALAKKYKVAFVAANKVGLPKIEYTNMDNILLIQPFYPINLKIRYRLPILNELYQLWLFNKLKKKFNDIEVINFDFSAYLIHKFFSNVYFYCNDNFVSISKKINNYFVYRYHTFCEKKLTRSCKLCIGTSTIIVSWLKKNNLNSHLILLGGPNIEEFNTVPLSQPRVSSKINVGLVGFIRNYNLSYQLINNILEQLDCRITFIGPVENDFLKNIKELNRIDIKGVLTGQELMDEVNKFDVAIAPYVEKKLNEGAFPNKLLIYLALGKPVVVSDLESLKQIEIPPDMIYMVKQADDFPKIIKHAHNSNTSEFILNRINFSKENTWDIRIGQFLDIINNS